MSSVGLDLRARPGRAPFAVQQRERLHALAQPHVVGQDPAQAQVAEEGQPGQSALLVRAQLAAERGGGGHRGQRAVSPPGEQLTQPAVRRDRRDLEVILRAAQPGHQHVAGPHHALAAALHERQRGPQVAVVQLHPLPADPDQRDLELGQLGELVRVQRGVADGQVVAELDQVVQAEAAPARCAGRGRGRTGGGPGPGGELEPQPGLAGPVRQQHTEPGAGQQRAGLLQEPERARGVQRERGGLRVPQRVLQLTEQPHGRAQPGQQFLIGAGDPARRPAAGPRPHVLSGQHQAGVLGRLERELDVPQPIGGLGGLVAGRLGGLVGGGSGGLIAYGMGRLVIGGLGGLDQAEAGSHGAGRGLGGGAPGVQAGGQLSRFRLVLRRGHLDLGIGPGQGGRPALRDRHPGRPLAAPRREQAPAQRGGVVTRPARTPGLVRRGRPVQPGPRGRVGQRVQRRGQQRPGRLAARLPGPAHRRHGPGQFRGPRGVRARQHRPPARSPAVAVAAQPRQYLAPGAQVGREPGHRRPVDRRASGDHVGVADRTGRSVRRIQAGQDRERGGRPEGQRGNPPAAQGGPAATAGAAPACRHRPGLPA